MNSERQVKYWSDGSIEDISIARLLIEKDKIRYGLFFCHLAVEKLLKAIYVKLQNDFAPKTHNLLYLCQLCGIEITEDQTAFFAILMKYQITGRYPDATETVHDSELAGKYFDQTEEALQWLRLKLNL